MKGHNYHYAYLISNLVLSTQLSGWNQAPKDIYSYVEIIRNNVQIISNYIEITCWLDATLCRR